MTWQTFDEWFSTLSPDEQQRTRAIVSVLTELGANDPESWARSEVSENIAQTARFNVMNRLNRDAVAPWSIPGEIDRASKYLPPFQKVVAELRALGASEDLLGRFAYHVARSTLANACYVLDEGSQPLQSGQCVPGWSLQETDADGSLTGRVVGGLHECIGGFFDWT